MLNSILEGIKKFFREVLSDIKKFKVSTIFLDTRLLIISILLILAVIFIATTMDLVLLFKGILSICVFYFVFLWRK